MSRKWSTLLAAVALIGLLLPAVASSAPRRSRSKASQDYGIPQVKFINEQLRATWNAYQLSPSKPATEGEWCRRVYLDIIGRVPSVVELKEFTSSRSAQKKADLVGKLLYDDEYIEKYARNWTTIWTNVLIGRSGGTERNSLTNREGMQQYLRRSFQGNKPYNDMVFDLMAPAPDTVISI